MGELDGVQDRDGKGLGFPGKTLEDTGDETVVLEGGGAEPPRVSTRSRARSVLEAERQAPTLGIAKVWGEECEVYSQDPKIIVVQPGDVIEVGEFAALVLRIDSGNPPHAILGELQLRANVHCLEEASVLSIRKKRVE